MNPTLAYDALDEALTRLGPNGVAVRGRVVPNHAPMALEALCALGAPPHVLFALADRARDELLPLAPRVRPVQEDSWSEALGNRAVADWLSLFRRAMDRTPWRRVVATWVPRLLRGVEAGGTHGLIRTAHAVRAMDVAVTGPRTEELAKALAYWAAELEPLPGQPTLDGPRSIEAAARDVPRVDPSFPRVGAPREFVRIVGSLDGFAEAVEAARAPDDPEAALDALLALGLRLYLANAENQPLVCLHTITAPAAVQLLLPLLEPTDRRSAVAYAWQAVAATIATYVRHLDGEPNVERTPAAVDDLVQRAISSSDVHVIKLTEACIRQARRGRPELLAAAQDWARRVDLARGWSVEQKRAAGMFFGNEPA